MEHVKILAFVYTVIVNYSNRTLSAEQAVEMIRQFLTAL